VRIRLLALGTVVALASASPLLAQQQDAAAMLANAQRSMVSRAELTATLDTLDRLLASSGYSPQLRTAKQAEASVIRERLTDGDLHTGDVIQMTVVGEAALSIPYAVTANRSIMLPGGTELQLKGVLRSELQDYLTEQLKKFVRDPIVRVTPGIRVSMFGGISKPGYHNVDANVLLSDALMSAGGGVANNYRAEKSVIKRGDVIVVDGPEFAMAVRNGVTLDKLNVEAGDEITVATKPAGGTFWRVLAGVSSVASLGYLATIIF
jgi:protein involved in polysaccharide export with SLBB domain